LLFTPLTFTTTLPVVAQAGTAVTIEVDVQLVVAAVVPLNVTAPVDPKLAPEIVTDAPTVPDVGDKAVMLGTGTTVNASPLLFIPLAVTTTFPLVAPVGTVATIDVAVQLAMVVAVVVLNFSVPCVVPKFAPVIVTDAPTAPVVGDKLVMLGATVNAFPLLFTPLA
jgi:hypothetical protein